MTYRPPGEMMSLFVANGGAGCFAPFTSTAAKRQTPTNPAYSAVAAFSWPAPERSRAISSKLLDMGCTFALRTLEENQLKSMLSQAGGRVRIVPRWRGSATAARASGFFSVDGQLLDTFLAFLGC